MPAWSWKEELCCDMIRCLGKAGSGTVREWSFGGRSECGFVEFETEVCMRDSKSNRGDQCPRAQG